MNRAVLFREFGGPEVLSLGELPMPVPQPGEVLVRVIAAGLNPSDLMMRSGAQAGMMKGLAPPYVAGMEFSGRIEAVGPGLAEDLPGRKVIGVVNPRRPAGGAHAEYIAVPRQSVALLPEGVDPVLAASLPMNALTALMALELTESKPGDVLLVTGGTGQLGGSVLQLARAGGIRLAATGSPEDSAELRSLGAEILLPRAPGPGALREAVPQGADALVDGALIGNSVSHLVRDGGVAVSLRLAHPIEDPRLRNTYVGVTMGMERQDLLQRIVGHFERGELRPRLAEDGLVPVRQAAEAHRRSESAGRRGRVLLTFGERDLAGPGTG